MILRNVNTFSHALSADCIRSVAISRPENVAYDVELR